MKTSPDKPKPKKRFADAKPKKRFDDAKAKKRHDYKAERTGDGTAEKRPFADKPGKRFGEKKRPFGDQAGKRFGDGKPARAPRTRTYHREEGQAATGGFDKGSKPPRPAELPRPEIAEAPAAGPRPTAEPMAGPGKDAVELVLTVPAALLRRLEAHAEELGVEVQPLVRVWLSDKLRS